MSDRGKLGGGRRKLTLAERDAQKASEGGLSPHGLGVQLKSVPESQSWQISSKCPRRQLNHGDAGGSKTAVAEEQVIPLLLLVAIALSIGIVSLNLNEETRKAGG